MLCVAPTCDGDVDSRAHLWQSCGEDLQLAACAALKQLYAGINCPSQAGINRRLSLEELRYLAQQRLDLQSTGRLSRVLVALSDLKLEQRQCCHTPLGLGKFHESAGSSSASADRLQRNSAVCVLYGRHHASGCRDWPRPEVYHVAGSLKRHHEAAGGGGSKGAFPVRHQQHVVAAPVCVEAVEVDGAVKGHDSDMLPLQSCEYQAPLLRLLACQSCPPSLTLLAEHLTQ